MAAGMASARLLPLWGPAHICQSHGYPVKHEAGGRKATATARLLDLLEENQDRSLTDGCEVWLVGEGVAEWGAGGEAGCTTSSRRRRASSAPAERRPDDTLQM